MISWLVACAVCLLVYLMVKAVGPVPSWRTITLFNQLQGPTDQPFFFGSARDYRKMKIEDVFPYMKKKFDEFNGWFAGYSMGQPIVHIADPETNKAVLSSFKNVGKGSEYKFFSRWLGEGILLSSGEKWKQRRKMLIPCFHFHILQGNIECMNRHWRNVAKEILIGSRGVPFDPLPLVEEGILNIFCESAMGTNLQDLGCSGAEFIAATKRAAQDWLKRNLNPLLKYDFLFDLTSLSKSFMGNLKIIHGFTEKIVSERKVVFAEEKKLEELESKAIDKKRQMLDTLLELYMEGRLHENDVKEEVDNLMLGGNDTTSVGVQFLIMHLAENPEVQEKAYQEQLNIFGNSHRDVQTTDLSKMHYLDKVIKENLRLHPPIPMVSRKILEDVKLPNGQIIPKGVKVLVNIFFTHRNPEYWEEPDAFKPERFSIEESKDRHPYAYIPFSAGPRNCIGQKFAMMGMKIFASMLLRFCRISAVSRSEDLKCKMGITLQSTTPIEVLVSPRV